MGKEQEMEYWDLVTEYLELDRRANEAYKGNRLNEALAYLKDIVGKYRTDYKSWFFMGRILMELGDIDGALEAMLKAEEHIRSNAHKEKSTAVALYLCLGAAWFSKYRYIEDNFGKQEAEARTAIEEANRAYEKSFGYSEETPFALYCAASCKAIVGNSEGALADLYTVVRKDPNYCDQIRSNSDFGIMRDDCTRLIEETERRLEQERIEGARREAEERERQRVLAPAKAAAQKKRDNICLVVSIILSLAILAPWLGYAVPSLNAFEYALDSMSAAELNELIEGGEYPWQFTLLDLLEERPFLGLLLLIGGPIALVSLLLGILSICFKSDNSIPIGAAAAIYIIVMAIILASGFWGFIGYILLVGIISVISAIPGFLMSASQGKT